METYYAIMGLLLPMFLVALYFLPWMEAYRRGHSKVESIAVLNLLLGWTFIGWVIALVWACAEAGKAKA